MRICYCWLVLALIAAACAPAPLTPPEPVISTETPLRATRIASDAYIRLGQQEYNLRCAHCHGDHGEGQLAATIPNTRSLGMNLVPAHDSTGHTWQHPDQLLVRVIKEGISNPLDQFIMEPYTSVMTDQEVHATLDYIKLWWTDEQRAYQQQLTDNWAKIDQNFGSGTN